MQHTKIITGIVAIVIYASPFPKKSGTPLDLIVMKVNKVQQIDLPLCILREIYTQAIGYLSAMASVSKRHVKLFSVYNRLKGSDGTIMNYCF